MLRNHSVEQNDKYETSSAEEMMVEKWPLLSVQESCAA